MKLTCPNPLVRSLEYLHPVRFFFAVFEPSQYLADVSANVDEYYALAPGPEAAAQRSKALDSSEVHVGQVGTVDDDRGRRVVQRLL